MSEPVLNEDQRDALQEVANLAMGQAATRLARLLDTFIELSVPRVQVVEISKAAAALRETGRRLPHRKVGNLLQRVALIFVED
jgi:chemotaxis protein CheC